MTYSNSNIFFKVDNLIDHERGFDYGGKLKSYQTYRLVRGAIDKGDIDEVSRVVKEMNSDLTTDDLDLNLLFYCVEKKCDDILKSLIILGGRTDGTLKVKIKLVPLFLSNIMVLP